MTAYTRKSFSVAAPSTDEYRKRWEQTFRGEGDESDRVRQQAECEHAPAERSKDGTTCEACGVVDLVPPSTVSAYHCTFCGERFDRDASVLKFDLRGNVVLRYHNDRAHQGCGDAARAAEKSNFEAFYVANPKGERSP